LWRLIFLTIYLIIIILFKCIFIITRFTIKRH
jgi:hypothetical protein